VPVLEKDIEGRVVKWAQKYKFLVVKVRFHDVGYPDRLFISPKGHTIFIEFKRPGEKPEPIQDFRIRMLRARGIPAYWANNFLTAVAILKAALDPETVPAPGDQAPSISSIGGAIPRPRPREDIDGPRYPQDSEDEGSLHTRVDRVSNSTDVPDMAGGDKEVD